MEKRIEISDNVFRQDAKTIVDMLFDKKLFVDDLTRDDMNALEDLVDLLLKSKLESHVRCHELLQSLDKSTNH